MPISLSDYIFQTFNFKPKNLALFQQALTHRSYLNETKNKNLKSFERLEFLGDAVLELYISQYIFHHYPQFSEGEMTNLRSNVVKTETLASLAKKISLGAYLFLSKGEEESNGRENESILADALEAVIAAIYLDTSYEETKKALNLYFPQIIEKKYQKANLKDYKSLLQEITQEKYKTSPVYRLLKAQGPDHHKLFTIELYINNQPVSRGEGYSKQKAEEEAAKFALEKIKR